MFETGFTARAWIGTRVTDNLLIDQALKFYPNHTSDKIYQCDTDHIPDTNLKTVVDRREE